MSRMRRKSAVGTSGKHVRCVTPAASARPSAARARRNAASVAHAVSTSARSTRQTGSSPTVVTSTPSSSAWSTRAPASRHEATIALPMPPPPRRRAQSGLPGRSRTPPSRCTVARLRADGQAESSKSRHELGAVGEQVVRIRPPQTRERAARPGGRRVDPAEDRRGGGAGTPSGPAPGSYARPCEGIVYWPACDVPPPDQEPAPVHTAAAPARPDSIGASRRAAFATGRTRTRPREGRARPAGVADQRQLPATVPDRGRAVAGGRSARGSAGSPSPGRRPPRGASPAATAVQVAVADHHDQLPPGPRAGRMSLWRQRRAREAGAGVACRVVGDAVAQARRHSSPRPSR